VPGTRRGHAGETLNHEGYRGNCDIHPESHEGCSGGRPQGLVDGEADVGAPVVAERDLVDGAARVYDPIVRGEAGEDLFGVFLKDYKPAAW